MSKIKYFGLSVSSIILACYLVLFIGETILFFLDYSLVSGIWSTVDDKVNGVKAHWVVRLLDIAFATALFETIVFQLVLLRGLNYISGNWCFLCVSASVIFGLTHPYTIGYIICAVLMGLVLNYAYLYLKKQHNERFAFASVFLSHMIINAIGVLSASA